MLKKKNINQQQHQMTQNVQQQPQQMTPQQPQQFIQPFTLIDSTIYNNLLIENKTLRIN